MSKMSQSQVNRLEVNSINEEVAEKSGDLQPSAVNGESDKILPAAMNEKTKDEEKLDRTCESLSNLSVDQKDSDDCALGDVGDSHGENSAPLITEKSDKTTGRSDETTGRLEATDKTEGCQKTDNPATDISGIKNSASYDSAGVDVTDVTQGDNETDKSQGAKFEHNKDPSYQQPETAFSVTDASRFRSHLFEAIEELRIRRAMDPENEEKIRQLVHEKHQLERKHEEAVCKNKSLLTEQSDTMTALDKQYQERIRNLQEEKTKFVSATECSNKEMKALKDEIRALQLTKYSLEKKLREQDQKLLLQNSRRENNLTQLAQLEGSCDTIKKKICELTCAQDRLQDNVTEATLLNKRLMYVNEHLQSCTLGSYKQEVSRLKSELLDARVDLDVWPSKMDAQLAQQLSIIQKLQLEIQGHQDSIHRVNMENESLKLDKKESIQSLKAAHELMKRHAENSQRNLDEKKVTSEKLSQMTVQYEQMKANFDAKEKDLQVEQEASLLALEKWKEQEQSLSSRLKGLTEDHKALTKSYTDLEELNSKWSKQNVDLQQQISRLQAELEKPKADAELQTEKADHDQEVQTEVTHVTEAETQTVAMMTKQQVTQTVILATQQQDTQTTVVTCTHQGIQCNPFDTTATGTQTDYGLMLSSNNHIGPSIKDESTQLQAVTDSESTQVKTSSAIKCSNPAANVMSHHGLSDHQKPVLKEDETSCPDTPPGLVSSQPISSQISRPDSPVLSNSQPTELSQSSPTKVPSSQRSKDSHKSTATGDLSPYSRFIASLKGTGTRDRLKLGRVAKSPPGKKLEPKTKNENRFTKRKSENIENENSQCEENKSENSTLARGTSIHGVNVLEKVDASIGPTGILQEPGAPRNKKPRKVHFSSPCRLGGKVLSTFPSGQATTGFDNGHTVEAPTNIPDAEKSLFPDEDEEEVNLPLVTRVKSLLKKNRLSTYKGQKT